MKRPVRMLYLGSKSQISAVVEHLCKDYFPVSTLAVEDEGCCDGSQLEDVGVVMVNLMFPWNVTHVIEEAKKRNLPVIGVHTFNNEAIINNYLSKGLDKYITLFELDENLEVLSQELKES